MHTITIDYLLLFLEKHGHLQTPTVNATYRIFIFHALIAISFRVTDED